MTNQMSEKPNIEEVISEINEAFSGTTIPADDNIVFTDWLNVDPEYDDIWRRFKGKLWVDVSAEDMVQRRNLHPFTPDGFRYFLPAHMLLVLQHPEEADTLNDSLIWSLIPEAGEGLFKRDRFFAIVSRLTATQKKAVKSFLGFLCKWRANEYGTDGAPCRALRTYWDQPGIT